MMRNNYRLALRKVDQIMSLAEGLIDKVEIIHAGDGEE